MKITLVTVGKIKEPYFEDAIREYAKRLSRYCKLDIIQVADEKTPDNAGEARGNSDQGERGGQDSGQYQGWRLCDRSGDRGERCWIPWNCQRKIASLGVSGTSQIVFVIGGSLGYRSGFSTGPIIC